MQFNSYIFILAYLPILLIGYFLLNKISITIGKVFMIAAGIVFYLYGGREITLILGGSILVNYLGAFIIGRIQKGKKAVLVAGIAANIALLFYFKYFNFFLQSIAEATGQEFTLREIILPLGISFFTFQQIMYVINVYQNNIKQANLIDYLVYILYFPKLIMGPLAEPAELIEQFNDKKRKKVNWDNISYGIKIFSFGLFKKMLLADTFAAAVAWGYSNIETSTSMDWFLIMLFYTFEIYFDFSGYSDMAVGISKMMNIDLPMNFDSPYKALSIRDFWKRWHMTLTGFLTRYIYIPLGGSKKGEIRTYINTMIVFLVSGIWHGANWTFLLWGGVHGLLSVGDRLTEKLRKNLSEVVKWGSTFFAVNILWLLFRSESIEQWKNLLVRMFTFQDMSVSDDLLKSFVLPETPFLLKSLHFEGVNTAVNGFGMIVFVICAYGICLIPENNYKKLEKNNWLTMILAAVAFVWSFLCLSSESVFVYFGF